MRADEIKRRRQRVAAAYRGVANGLRQNQRAIGTCINQRRRAGPRGAAKLPRCAEQLRLTPCGDEDQAGRFSRRKLLKVAVVVRLFGE